MHDHHHPFIPHSLSLRVFSSCFICPMTHINTPPPFPFFTNPLIPLFSSIATAYSSEEASSHTHIHNLKLQKQPKKMSGVWVFRNGVFRLVENPQAEASSDGRQGSGSRKKVLVHLPTGQVVSSYSSLEQILTGLGWERYYGGDPDLFQFHKHSSIDLISLPREFSKFNSVYMYDIVIKNPNIFHVRDM